uniref:Uncharacterized protein n=1 Tax=Rhizophora mucronata TaxID=61149 RepID=A0A2P2QJL3_RHIMU
MHQTFKQRPRTPIKHPHIVTIGCHQEVGTI